MDSLRQNRSINSAQKISERFYRGFGDAPTPRVFTIVNKGSDEAFPVGGVRPHHETKKSTSHKKAALSAHRKLTIFHKDHAPYTATSVAEIGVTI